MAKLDEIAPEFRKTYKGVYIGMFMIYGMFAVLVVAFLIIKGHDASTYPLQGMLVVLAIIVAVLAAQVRKQLWQGSLILREAAPQEVQVLWIVRKFGQQQGGYKLILSFVDQTLPPALSQRSFATSVNPLVYQDIDTPQQVTLYTLATIPNVIVVRFANDDLETLVPFHKPLFS